MSPSGKLYETQAADLLAVNGLKLVARNFSQGPGEIDIVALDGEQLVFVEVRARSNRRFESAAGSVDARKQRRIIQTAAAFLQREPQFANLSCRFDVIAFEPPQSGGDRPVNWIRGAFTA